MGHAVHFLQRIERLSPAQADLALTLYREPELVAHVLGRVRLPDGAERVALALENAPGGPHVIVTRDGRFVTCLGAGMSVSDCPVVSRPQIDHASDKLEALRATLAGGQSETRRLYRRLMERGSGLSREDFTALAALAPILGKEYVGMALDVCRYVLRFHNRHHRGKYRKLTPALRDELHHYWTFSWALGHLAALCGERPDDVQALWADDGRVFQSTVQTMLAASLAGSNTPIVMRSLWAVARAGRMLLAEVRQQFQEARMAGNLLIYGMALVAIGLRHRRTQGEVSKALARYRRSLQVSGPEDNEDKEDNEGNDSRAREQLVIMLEQQFEPDLQERARTAHRNTGARGLVRYTAYFPEDAPLRFTRAEDVPDELAMPALMHLHSDLFASTEDILFGLMMLPWLATVDGPSLYLPAQILDQGRSLFDPEELAQRIDKHHRADVAMQPARAEARPGRNEPCPCGSGKKYKRCCGAEDTQA
jgi:hypothetical protein